jgi:uncharacterized protein
MTVADLVVVDTNILVYSIDVQSAFHLPSRAIVERAQSADAGLCFAPQNLAEFFATVTNPRRVTSPKTPEEALITIESFLALPGFEVLPAPVDLVERWVQLCRKCPLSAGDIFDAQLAAIMLANGVETICTYNTEDFHRFPGIKAMRP